MASISHTTSRGGDTIDAEHRDSDAHEIQGWIDLAQAGDGAAFDRLARHFLPTLRRWALVRTGDPDDADDVVQRTLLQAFAKIGSLRGAGAIKGWLYRITSNAAGDLRRRIGARSRALERLEAHHPTDAPQTPQDVTGGEELRGLVRTFLEELSDQQRMIMDLVDLQGMSPTEAGKVLGLNPNTARVHLLRARRRMREHILEARPSIVEDLTS